jgi:hypothetical protein
MSRNYKFRNQEKLYFVTFSVILWIDVFMGDRLFQNTGYYVHWANQAEKLEQLLPQVTQKLNLRQV